MNQNKHSLMSWMPILLLLPYLLIVLFQGTETVRGIHTPDFEDCLPIILQKQSKKTDPIESIKAQAVIARTIFFRKIKEKNLLQIFLIMKEEWGEKENRKDNWHIFWREEYDQWEKAVEETEDQILMNGDQIPLLPYHAVSSGRTRDGKEVLHDDAYSYLVSVDSMQDLHSPDYKKDVWLSEELFPQGVQVISRDSCGYVVYLQKDGKLLEGESFRIGMLLPSADFVIKKEDGCYLFQCKGSGHGLGYSQYGGTVLAKEGKNYQEILKYYFPKLSLRKIDN